MTLAKRWEMADKRLGWQWGNSRLGDGKRENKSERLGGLDEQQSGQAKVEQINNWADKK